MCRKDADGMENSVGPDQTALYEQSGLGLYSFLDLSVLMLAISTIVNTCSLILEQIFNFAVSIARK